MALPPTGRRAVTPLLAVAALAALPLLGACSDDAAPAESPQDAVEAAAATLAGTTGVYVAISTDDPPSGIAALVAADGSLTAAPAFDGTITLSYAGLEPQVPVVAVDGDVWAQLPLTTGWTSIDPADYGAPDPTLLLDEDTGVPALLRATTDLAAGDAVRGGADNAEVLTPYTGTVPGDLVAAVVGEAGAPDGDVSVTYLLTSDDELRSAEVSGGFYGSSSDTTYTVDLTDYGDAPDVSAPQ
ncbi:LppX_LprAFG lipoprotein [Nocardioides sp. GY 10127]|uniref:LppX_LprAFG lipoprotein n=1 Tax=Nocardioides sp. GY 10127 TaxID=2569762 RepID=UPI0010A898F4|nr:LppX_LprAFG lipoprotein [Nocardioides sp. GY 10127]TIC85406.1 LppX_LprAFG lipoprotein [Nocardioides sp. GY 10127]